MLHSMCIVAYLLALYISLQSHEGTPRCWFVIRLDSRCIYNDHINGRLQEDFGNGNGVSKDMRQELGLAAWIGKSSQPSWTHPRQVLRAAMAEAPAEKTGFDVVIKDAQVVLPVKLSLRCLSPALS